MPKIGEVVLNPDETIGGAEQTVTFKPVRVTDGLVTFQDRSNPIQIAQTTLTVSSVPPSKTSRNNKVRIRVVYPKIATPVTSASGFTPAPQKISSLVADITFIVPDISTDEERAGLLALTKRLLTSWVVKEPVQNMEQFY